jgi:FtsP/CotA-like multicopper oxidase with cupredoxin domain
MVRLTDGSGNMLVAPDRKRQLILKEAQGPGGPLEVLVNNTKFDGLKSPGIQVEFPGDGVSELPRVGSTELWEIINLTMDAHPMHTHLVQFQIVDRQPFNTDTVDPVVGYPAKWASAFFNGANAKCGTPSFDDTNPCPGYGPPLSYKAFNADGALGGNPAVGPYLVGAKRPPAPEESGWKDTAKAIPGEVLRILVRWAPTSTPVKWASPGRNFFPFDPTKGPGYVWHCHIIDHEDNEMMRPYSVAR